MKTRQAFLTDDQKARKLGEEFMGSPGPQTTPHLVGWLFFHGHLIDQDKADVIEEHESMKRPLSKYFEKGGSHLAPPVQFCNSECFVCNKTQPKFVLRNQSRFCIALESKQISQQGKCTTSVLFLS